MKPERVPAPEPKQPVGLAGGQGFALAFGLFLGLALWKFGNPVVLDPRVEPPTSFVEAWSQSWPPRWSFWCLMPVALFGIRFAIAHKAHWTGSRWLWVWPLAWFGCQLASTTQSLDGMLTVLTLMHFSGCVLCYFIGNWSLGEERSLRVLLIGLMAAFAVCLVRAANQKLLEFPQEKQALLEGERIGWTNFTPEVVRQMKAEGIILTTNGMDMANPVIVAKYDKGRVFGTLFYPNALAGAVLLLLPVALTLAITETRGFGTPSRCALIGLALFLGVGSLLWSQSRSGWLIAVAMLGTASFRLNWSLRWKWLALLLVVVVGAAVFALRFHHYLAAGATSVGARLDYWHAAVKNTIEHPLLGSGPGTFQRAYVVLKRPESEMARLAHNDYLEQFSDSGVFGGVSYLAWIGLLLGTLARGTLRGSSPTTFAISVGLLGWFTQGLSEFGLYIPALAWAAFALAGGVLRLSALQEKSRATLAALGNSHSAFLASEARDDQDVR